MVQGNGMARVLASIDECNAECIATNAEVPQLGRELSRKAIGREHLALSRRMGDVRAAELRRGPRQS